MFENTRTQHVEEVSVLKNNYETRLLELKKIIDNLNETIDGIKQENGVLNKSLTETRAENMSLRNNYEFIIDRNENLQKKLNEAVEMTQKSIHDRKLTSESTDTQYNVSEQL